MRGGRIRGEDGKGETSNAEHRKGDNAARSWVKFLRVYRLVVNFRNPTLGQTLAASRKATRLCPETDYTRIARSALGQLLPASVKAT